MNRMRRYTAILLSFVLMLLPVFSSVAMAEEVQETAIVETPVAEQPVVETPVVETPVVETPVVEEPVVETPVVEEPVVETPVVEEPVVEEPTVEEPVVETPVVEEPVIEEPVIDCTQDLTRNPAFATGYAFTLASVSVFASDAASETLGTLGENSPVSVTGRPHQGEDNELAAVSFSCEGQSYSGYVPANQLRPMTEEEAAQAGSLSVGFTPAAAQEEPEPVDPINYAADLTSNPEFLSGPAVTLDATKTFTSMDGSAAAGQLPAGACVTVTERAALGSANELVRIAFLYKEANYDVYVAAASLRPLAADEAAAQTSVTDYEDYFSTETRAFPGSITLTAGSTTQGSLPAPAASVAYFNLTLTQSCRLTMLFKAIETGLAAGNLEITVQSASQDATVIWNGTLAAGGSSTFTDFVNRGNYDIIIRKSSPTTDTNAYSFTILPTIIFAGELNAAEAPNNTATTAVTLPVDGILYTGIRSRQDASGGYKDFYKVVLNTRSKMTVSLENRVGTPITVDFYGDDATTRFSSITFTGNSGSEISYTTRNQSSWFDAGTYYIVVYDASSSSATGRYGLRATSEAITVAEVEPNNSRSQATGVNTLTVDKPYVTGVLTESDPCDYFHFSLSTNLYIRASVLAQMRSIVAEIRDVNDKVVASFGGANTVGEEGAPYEYEKKDILLEAGNYYLYVAKDPTAQQAGLYSVQLTSLLTITDITITNPSGRTLQGVYAKAGGTGKLLSTRFTVYNSSNKVISINTTSNTVSAAIPASDTYRFEVLLYDGVTWRTLSKSIWFEVVPLTLNSFTVSADAQGIVHCTASVSGGNPLVYSNYAIYRNGAQVTNYCTVNSLTGALKAPISGTYAVQYVASDGYNTVEKWATVDVIAPPAELPLSISSLTLSSTSSTQITANIVTANGRTVTATSYALYYNGSMIANWYGNSKTHTFTVSAAGTYAVQVAVTDGITTPEKWETINIAAPSAILQVKSVTATVNNNGLISCSATTSGGHAVGHTIFGIYKDGSLVTTIPGTGASTTYQALVSGSYQIQFVAFDGVTWAEGYSVPLTVTISGSNPLTVTSMTAVAPDDSGTITCTAQIANGKPLISSRFYLYLNGSMVANSADLSLTHKFYVNTPGDYAVQYIASDGITTVVKWAAVTVKISSSSYDLAIVGQTLTDGHNGTLSCNVQTQYGRGTVNYAFVLWYEGRIVAQRTGTSNTATFTGLPYGFYAVQIVAADSVTRKEVWPTITTTSVSASLDSITATLSGSTVVSCVAAVTGTYYQITYVVRNAAGVELGRWTGTSLTHDFNVSGAAGGTVQCVVFDGTNWLEKWASIT